MKRTKYDSEYERVRRSAPKPPPAPPIPERPRSPREIERANVQAMVDEIDEHNAQIAQAERERFRESQIENARLAREFNERAIRADYEARGLTPPVGTLVSLGTLLFTGWTIGEDGNKRAVLIPPPVSKAPRKRREDYDQST